MNAQRDYRISSVGKISDGCSEVRVQSGEDMIDMMVSVNHCQIASSILRSVAKDNNPPRTDLRRYIGTLIEH